MSKNKSNRTANYPLSNKKCQNSSITDFMNKWRMIKVNYYHHKILILLIPRKKQYNDKNRNDPNYVIKSTTDLIPF